MKMQSSQLPRSRAARAQGLPLRLVAFGSSTTEGSGSSGPDNTYPMVARRALLEAFPAGIMVVNHGIGGDTALEMDRRLDKVVAERPDLVIWQTGSNDPLREVPLDTFDRLTRSGIGRLRATGADLVLMDQQYCRTLEENALTASYVDAVQTIARDEGIALFRRGDRMRAWCADGDFTRDTLSPDGMHMTDPGYARLGNELAAWLIERI